jgi:signal transduction histidine kinase
VGLSLAWFVVAVSTTAITGAALGYVSWRENDRALKLWAAAWLLWAVAGVSLMIIGEQQAPPHAAVLSGLVWVASAVFFLRGTYVFAGREFPRPWYAVAAIAVASAISLGMGPAAPTGMIPLMLFQSVGLFATGVLLVRSERRHTGAWLAGGALVLLALHVLDAPLLARHPYWLQWGFVLATALQLVAALGMLMLYYEQARVRLLATERALEETRRLETLGRIAGGVAHDFNNVLTIVRGHLDLMRLTQQALANEHLSAIESAVDQAERLTRQLLAFGRRTVLQVETADVQAVIEETLQMLEKVTPKNIKLSFAAKPDDYRARIDRVLLEQIVLNLVTNARDAIDGSGEIHVELGRSESTPPTLMLRVADDGLGMAEETKRQIFDPFFTTKRPGKGTGLGLASVHGAVTQLGGVIEVESQLGRGTRFEVHLPWLLPESNSAPQSGASEQPQAAAKKVDIASK